MHVYVDRDFTPSQHTLSTVGSVHQNQHRQETTRLLTGLSVVVPYSSDISTGMILLWRVLGEEGLWRGRSTGGTPGLHASVVLSVTASQDATSCTSQHTYNINSALRTLLSAASAHTAPALYSHDYPYSSTSSCPKRCDAANPTGHRILG